jgi:hypothetical protein
VAMGSFWPCRPPPPHPPALQNAPATLKTRLSAKAVARGVTRQTKHLLVRYWVPWEDTPHIFLERSWYCSAMMKRATLAIADIYVPVKRRATLDQMAGAGRGDSVPHSRWEPQQLQRKRSPERLRRAASEIVGASAPR